MSTVIQVKSLSKIYRLGEIGTGTISRDLERWYKMKIKGQEDPFLKIGETNERSKKGAGDVVYALRDINFEVQQGEALGIIGKNGAGKSTLLKLISRVTSPTTGKIRIKGRVASLLEVGTGFHPELTGRENIYLNGAILGMRKKEITGKLDEIIDFSGVERYIDTPVKRYSSGMYVRLAFAVAAHLESEILIVDEVLAVGDAEFQKKCLGKMGEVSKGEGRTVLFVSHNLIAVKQLCNKGIILTNGVLSFSGSSEEAVQNYLLVSSNEKRITHEKYEIGNYPGGEIVELLEYSLLNLGNKKIDKFNLYEEVKIELVFKVKQKGFSSFPNMHFFNQQDQCLFAISTNNDTRIYDEGIYKTTFIIPPYTFNVGIFKAGIAVTCYPGTDVQFYINPAITFEVEESNIELRKTSYTGVMPGEFRPQMHNNTIKL
jgi:lipopolysaccharide transport system ATP-binding protein